MLHLSPETGKWLSCPFEDDGKCKLLYHAPVEEGEVAESLLWEMYASEELYRKPSKVLAKRRIWANTKGHHREYDLPAIEWTDGTKEWYQNGKLHRTDGPAFVRADGYKEWYKNGVHHRTDGPAIEHADGGKLWYQNGKRHRTDGPAIEHADGYEEWYQNDKLHRVDGPAIEDVNVRKEWWINGVRVGPGSTAL